MSNIHDPGDLWQMQQLPLEAKIVMSQRRIYDWFHYWQGDVYVSFSGGKDSTVLKHLVETTDGIYDVPVVFVDTGLEYPEVRKFATERADVVLRPEMRFDEVISTYGYPVVTKRVADTVEGARRSIEKGVDSMRLQCIEGRYPKMNNGQKSMYNCDQWNFLLDAPFKISAKCCDVMKKRPLQKYNKETGRKPILGTMASESLSRKVSWQKNGCNAYHSSDPKGAPMSFWTEQDVLEYLRRFDLPYASVYGDIVEENGVLKTTGCDRTGCMFCLFGCHRQKGQNRFQLMKETHPRQYDYCMRPVEEKGLGLKTVLEYIGVPYE